MNGRNVSPCRWSLAAGSGMTARCFVFLGTFHSHSRYWLYMDKEISSGDLFYRAGLLRSRALHPTHTNPKPTKTHQTPKQKPPPQKTTQQPNTTPKHKHTTTTKPNTKCLQFSKARIHGRFHVPLVNLTSQVYEQVNSEGILLGYRLVTTISLTCPQPVPEVSTYLSEAKA
ncbi:hypothetical protein J6590_094053 [Homalodisca vitripennis]|nr:hypothetical protein J6590_094053 [Homalodisca vitripennis]